MEYLMCLGRVQNIIFERRGDKNQISSREKAKSRTSSLEKGKSSNVSKMRGASEGTAGNKSQKGFGHSFILLSFISPLLSPLCLLSLLYTSLSPLPTHFTAKSLSLMGKVGRSHKNTDIPMQISAFRSFL